MKKVLLFTVLFIFVFYTNVSAKTYKLVTGDDFPPFTTKKVPSGGIATELVQRIFKEMGHATTLDWLPWKRVQASLKLGDYFATFPYNMTPEREKDFYFSEAMILAKSYFFVRQDSGIKYEKDEDLQGLRVANPLGYEVKTIRHLLDKKIVELDIHVP